MLPDRPPRAARAALRGVDHHFGLNGCRPLRFAITTPDSLPRRRPMASVACAPVRKDTLPQQRHVQPFLTFNGVVWRDNPAAGRSLPDTRISRRELRFTPSPSTGQFWIAVFAASGTLRLRTPAPVRSCVPPYRPRLPLCLSRLPDTRILLLQTLSPSAGENCSGK